MRYSRSFLRTLRTTSEEGTYDLLLRMGAIQQVAAGIFAVTPFGHRVIRRIEQVVRNEMEKTGALEMALPILQPASLWRESQRWEQYGADMMRLSNRTGQDFCLGPTHEELVTTTVKNHLVSGAQLPLTVFQLGRKFRDELRPRHGLLRTREFIMKDAYSFDRSVEEMQKTYQAMREAYERIFQKLGIRYTILSADSGEMGGGFSEEFVAFGQGEEYVQETDSGWVRAAEGQSVIELGHIFQLGDRYSQDFSFHIDGNYVQMGCYGIGITRALHVIAEQYADTQGVQWPESVTPFKGMVIDLSGSEEVYQLLQENGHEVLFDDRDERMGTKIRDAKLMGLRMFIRGKNTQAGCVEVEERDGSRYEISLDNLSQYLNH